MTRVDGRAPGAQPAPKGPKRQFTLEKGRALGVLIGLLVFAGGFAIAATFEAVAVITGGTPAGKPIYLIGIGGGFVGLGIVAFFMNRGTIPLPEGALWAPSGVRLLARSVGWHETLTYVLVYALGLWGVFGNIVLPVVLSVTKK